MISFQMDGKDFLPQSVCRHCINRIQTFDKFCDDVTHNQELLRLSKSKEQNNLTNLIELSSGDVPFANESGTLIITLASSAVHTSDIVKYTEKSNDNSFIDVISKEQIICSETSTEPTILNTINMEQELDNFASKDVAAESENEEDVSNEDEDADGNGTEDLPPGVVDSSANVHNKDFPAKILDGCKFLYNGPDLLNMISRFYHLECDQCE